MPEQVVTIIFTAPMRPFFLAAALHAFLTVPSWLIMYFGILPSPGAFEGTAWHLHEMLFGYTAAVIAGFIMTAVPNWTGTKPPKGIPLAILFLLWLAARLTNWLPLHLPIPILLLIDGLFLVCLAIWVTNRLVRSGNYRNLIVAAILWIFALANILHQLEQLDVYIVEYFQPHLVALNCVIALIVIIGGRITPTFTRNALRRQGDDFTVRDADLRDKAAILLMFLAILGEIFAADTMALDIIFVLAGMVVASRLIGWGTIKVLNQPILWILHLAYGWVALGLFLKGMSGFADWLDPSFALHALGIGGIGSMTLAMMTRAALGHTGRPLVVHKLIVLAYVLISFAAVLRMAAPYSGHGLAGLVVLASALGWSVAFGCFLYVYWPILTQQRVS